MQVGGMAVSKIFSTAGLSQPALRLTNNDKVLITKGIIVDTIEKVGSCKYVIRTTDDMKLLANVEVIMACMAEIADMLESTEQYRTKESKMEVLSRLSICDRSQTDTKASESILEGMQIWVTHVANSLAARIERPNFWKHAVTISESVLKNEPPREENLRQNPPATFQGAAFHQLHHTIRCRTANGYLCQVPAQSQVGDKIVIIQGCEVPYLFRPSHAATYTVVGNCYVHGIMYGEAWDESLVQDIQIS
jgi:hypothetical protein